jgi:hypothetical protein
MSVPRGQGKFAANNINRTSASPLVVGGCSAEPSRDGGGPECCELWTAPTGSDAPQQRSPAPDNGDRPPLSSARCDWAGPGSAI